MRVLLYILAQSAQKIQKRELKMKQKQKQNKTHKNELKIYHINELYLVENNSCEHEWMEQEFKWIKPQVLD